MKNKNDIYKIKIKTDNIENFGKYFPKLKNYKGWIDVSLDVSVISLFCSVFNIDINDKNKISNKITYLINFYLNRPLLKSILTNNKRGFSRMIQFILLRESIKKIDKNLFQNFNDNLDQLV